MATGPGLVPEMDTGSVLVSCLAKAPGPLPFWLKPFWLTPARLSPCVFASPVCRLRCLGDAGQAPGEHDRCYDTPFQSIMMCDADVRKDLISNVALSVDTTRLPCFGERVTKDSTVPASTTMCDDSAMDLRQL